MHDNILEWMRNPFVLFILIAISGFFGYLFATGKLNQFVSVLQTLLIPVKMILESKGILPKTAAPAQPASSNTQDAKDTQDTPTN